jgi:hypothetical protein
MTMLDGVVFDGEPSGGKSKAEWRARGRSSMGGGMERGGNPSQHWMRVTLTWAAAVTDAYVLSVVSTITV